MFTERMVQLIAVVLERDTDRVTRALLDLGVLEFIRITELKSEWASKVQGRSPKIAQSKVAELRKRIEVMLRQAELAPGDSSGLDPARLVPIDLEDTTAAIDRLSSQIQEVHDRQKNIQAEVVKLEEMKRQLQLFGDVGAVVRARSRYSFLSVNAGTLPTPRVDAFDEALRRQPSALIRYESNEKLTTVLVIGLKRNDAELARMFAEHGWSPIEFPRETAGLHGDAIAELDRRLGRLRAEQDELADEVRRIVTARGDELRSLWANLRMNELYFTIQSYFSRTSRTVLFSGWLPASKRRALERELRAAAGGRCYLEWNAPDRVFGSDGKRLSVPVSLKNPRFLAPFQMLVENYSIPEYGTVDPTPIVAVAFLIMYGMMFGDAGQGLVLLAVGIVGSILFRRKSDTWFRLSNLVVWCGSMSILAGAAFGSYFGMRWFAPLWFDYEGIVSGHTEQLGFVQNLNSVLTLTIYFGVLVIAVGLALNWINLFSKRRWFKLLLDKTGLLGGWTYGVGVYVAGYYASHSFREFPDMGFIAWAIGIPALLFGAKAPIEFALHARREGKRFRPSTVVDFLMGWVVELLEVFSGYLANTLSFLRVAGLGIAHVSLMVAFFQMAKMVGTSAGGYSVWSIIVLLLGNVLVIVLEGFTAGVQSLRLNYYEFFSKYFSGSGKAYSPVSLRAREPQEV